MNDPLDRTATSMTPLVVGVVLVLTLAAAVAFLGRGADEPGPGFDPAAVAAPVIEGAPLPADAVGRPAPSVLAEALLSEGQQEAPVPDQATMIVFLAHWCPACNAEVPVVNAWLATDPLPDRVEVRAVATGIDPTAANYPPTTWLRERDWVVPTLVDVDNSIGDAYGLPSYPYWVFVDVDGTVVGTGGGQTVESLDRIAAELDPER